MDLRDLWTARSLASVWPLTLSEWQCASVDAVCEVLVAARVPGTELRGASQGLGEQRAQIGAHLSETRADFDIPLGLAGIERAERAELLDALTMGWAEYSVDRLTAVASVDNSQMATLPYLTMRLGEIYREAELTGEDVAVEYLLVVAETDAAETRLLDETRLCALQSALRYAFVGGESIVAMSSHRALALTRRDEPRLSDSLARLRSELKIALAEDRLPSARCWRQTLPPDASQLSLGMLGVMY